MSAPVVASHGLSKRFGRVVAVDDIDLRVGEGDIYAFLGLNGAGKSTTIRMLLGMVRPSAGRAELFGLPVRADAPDLWRRVGHLVEVATAYPELSVRENLEVARRLHGASRARLEAVLERLGLGTYRDRRARALSLGNLQRLALARALLHEPRLLMLDEPINGLDPAGVVEVRELLRALARDEGVTVFLSSHILSEVERLATRVGVVHRGRLVEELDLDGLERLRRRRVVVGVSDPAAGERALLDAGYRPRRVADGGLADALVLDDGDAVAHPEAVNAALCRAGQPPNHLTRVHDDLEQHFMGLVGGGAAPR